MARQNIELGTPPSGVGGDTPRSANTKINANFVELYSKDLEFSALIGAGGVVESGSNGNGWFVKLADGTLYCSGISARAVTTSTQGGSMFHSELAAFTFPIPFVGNVPRIAPGVLTTTNYYSWAAMEGNVSANLTGTAYRLVSPVNNATGYICYLAIGRWK